MLLVIPLKSIIYVYVYIKCQISILFGDHSRTGQTAACYVGWSPATIPNRGEPQQETALAASWAMSQNPFRSLLISFLSNDHFALPIAAESC